MGVGRESGIERERGFAKELPTTLSLEDVDVALEGLVSNYLVLNSKSVATL